MQWKIAWRSSARLIGWWPWLISCGALLAVLGLLQGKLIAAQNGIFVLHLIVPLALAVQCALAFMPAEEPMLEIALAAPRPTVWLLGERLLLIGMAHLVSSGLTLGALGWLGIAGLGSLAGRWLVAAVWIAGLALWITQLGRQGSVGLIVGLLLGIGFWAVGDLLTGRWPWLQPIHPFLRPQLVSSSAYWLNRLTLSLGGLGLIGAAGWLLRDAERVLGHRRRWTWRLRSADRIKEQTI